MRTKKHWSEGATMSHCGKLKRKFKLKPFKINTSKYISVPRVLIGLLGEGSQDHNTEGNSFFFGWMGNFCRNFLGRLMQEIGTLICVLSDTCLGESVLNFPTCVFLNTFKIALTPRSSSYRQLENSWFYKEILLSKYLLPFWKEKKKKSPCRFRVWLFHHFKFFLCCTVLNATLNKVGFNNQFLH